MRAELRGGAGGEFEGLGETKTLFFDAMVNTFPPSCHGPARMIRRKSLLGCRSHRPG